MAVKFNEYLHRDTRTILSKSLDERAKKGNMKLTSDNLKKFAHFSEMKEKLGGKGQEFFDMDESTKNFLRTDFGFYINEDKDLMNNSLTNFHRSYAFREFDNRNNLLKNSQISRMSQSGFLTSKGRSFNKEYNFALRIVKEWVINSCKDAENVHYWLWLVIQRFCGPCRQEE